jgi:photosystem II stability/assembly factor-like uncharacterized protein
MILPLLLTVLLATAEPSWQRHASLVTDDLHAAFFLDDSKGWVLAHQSGAVLRTVDGGATWTVQAHLGEGFLESIQFLDERTGWICGDKGRLYRTDDGGATWKDRSLGRESLSLYGLRFLDRQCGLLVGLDTASGKAVLFDTSDGGATWTPHQDLPPLRGLADALAFPTATTGFAGGFGALLATHDGGRTWQMGKEVQGGILRDLWFLDERTGWAVGHDGLVLRTQDGGTTWERLPPFTHNRLRSLRFLDAQHGWICGDASPSDPGVLFATTDGGTTWQRVALDAPDLHRFAESPSRLWLVGKGGAILSRPKRLPLP